MLVNPAADPNALVAVEALESLVSAHFGLGERDLVMASERIEAGQPATVVLFWKDGVRHRLVLFRPAGEVTAADLPPAWLASGLVDESGECC
jgi:hypothetical protein